MGFKIPYDTGVKFMQFMNCWVFKRFPILVKVFKVYFINNLYSFEMGELGYK